MASKRMFERSIIDTDRFSDMPMSAKALYFLLGVEADDFGFVSPKRIMRVHGGSDDDVKILIAKNFVIPFETGVVVITDWNKHNWLDKRHIKPTEYQEELSQLHLVGKKYHVGTPVEVAGGFLEDSKNPRRIPLDDSKKSLREPLETSEKSLGEISIDKISLDESSLDISTEAETNTGSQRTKSDTVVKTKPEQGTDNVAITLILNDKSEYPIYHEQVTQWAELYPAVDIMQELRGMKGWSDANPKKRKTKRGINSFINSWLAKAQDRGGRGYVANANSMNERGGRHGANGSDYQIGGPDDPYRNVVSGTL